LQHTHLLRLLAQRLQPRRVAAADRLTNTLFTYIPLLSSLRLAQILLTGLNCGGISISGASAFSALKRYNIR